MVRFIIVGNEFYDRSHIAHNSGISVNKNQYFFISLFTLLIYLNLTKGCSIDVL